MTDAFWAALFSFGAIIVQTIAAAIVTIILRRKVAREAEVVKADLATVHTAVAEHQQQAEVERKEILNTVSATHGLVNSGQLAQLRLIAYLRHREAERDPTPENIALAKEADLQCREQSERQARVDRGDPRSGPITRSPDTP